VCLRALARAAIYSDDTHGVRVCACRSEATAFERAARCEFVLFVLAAAAAVAMALAGRWGRELGIDDAPAWEAATHASEHLDQRGDADTGVA
jgi:hypothetical protein